MFQIGPYWINPQHIVYCHDRSELPQPTIHVYMHHVGGDQGTCLTLDGEARTTLLAWLQQQLQTVGQ